MAESIFEGWNKINRDEYFDELDISIIEGHVEGVSEGYFMFLTSNMDKVAERSMKQGFPIDETLFFLISRYQHMDADIFSNNLNVFKKQFERLEEFYLAPACFKSGKRNDNLGDIELNFRLMLKMRKIKFLKAEDLTENDVKYIVIKNSKK